jgi:hypothetical protein
MSYSFRVQPAYGTAANACGDRDLLEQQLDCLRSQMFTSNLRSQSGASHLQTHPTQSISRQLSFNPPAPCQPLPPPCCSILHNLVSPLTPSCNISSCRKGAKHLQQMIFRLFGHCASHVQPYQKLLISRPAAVKRSHDRCW